MGDSSAPLKQQSPLSLPVIVGIAVGAAAIILFTISWLCLRRRRRRALRLPEEKLPKGIRKRNRASSLSFRCQTHLTPKSPNFPLDLETGADGGARISILSRLSIWQTKDISPVEPKAALGPKMSTTKVQQKDASLLITTDLPPRGSPKPQSPRSWMSPDEYRTPSSTTSMRSTSALLPPIAAYDPVVYSPPSRSQPNPHWEPQRPKYASPTSSTKTSSPSLGQGGWPLPAEQRSSPRIRASAWERPPRGDSLAPYTHLDNKHEREVSRSGRQSGTQGKARLVDMGGGSPTESTVLKVTFPPPPQMKGRR
jgi:hypothetical protein